MVVRAITLGIEVDEIEQLKNLYTYTGDPSFVQEYSRWDDARFIISFGDPKLEGTYCQELVERLAQRRLLKQVFEEKLTALPENSRDVLAGISKPRNRQVRRTLEQRIAESIQQADVRLATRCADSSHMVIVNSYTPKAVRELSRNDEGPILVRKRKGADLTTFENESDMFRSLSSEPVQGRFAVYAPVDYENPTLRRELQRAVYKPIMKCLEDISNG